MSVSIFIYFFVLNFKTFCFREETQEKWHLTIRRALLFLISFFFSCLIRSREEEGVSLGRLEVLLDEGAGVGAGTDVALVQDALAVALLSAQARARLDGREVAVLGR